MTMISARAVEVLREERVKLLNVVKRIDGILGDAEAGPGTDDRPRHDKPTGRKRGQQRRYDWDRGGRMFADGKQVKEIADALGCSLSAVKTAKRRDGWRRSSVKKPEEIPDQVAKRPRARKRVGTDGHGAAGRRARGKRAGAKSKGGGRPSIVMCPNCEKGTSVDPCSECHTALPKVTANRLAVLAIENGGRPA